MKIRLLIILILAIGALVVWQRVALREFATSLTKESIPPAIVNVEEVDQPSDSTNASVGEGSVDSRESTTEEEPTLPEEVNLAVPFTSQAPHANWDLPYQEACEEAAAIMVHRYWEKRQFASKEDADSAILRLVAFQEQQYGFYKDTTADETARFIRDRWGYEEVDVFKGSDVTIERMKREVANGFPVIVLAAGRMLGNPNFRHPGPLYHALVIKGYTKKGTIITNDPGTRNGADYLYNPEVLLNAIHDWNGGDVEHGQRVMIVVRRR